MATSRVCSFPDCGKKHLAHGYCRGHYDQTRKGNEPTPLSGEPARQLRAVPITEMLSFIEMAVRTDTAQCIDWPWMADRLHHGKFKAGRVKGKVRWVQAHRIACRVIHGPPPFKEAQAAHGCGRACCVNPKHLRWATPAQNMADKKIHGTQPRGVETPQAKLTDGLVRKIREESKRWPVRVLAKRYEMSVKAINSALYGQAWAHVEGAKVPVTFKPKLVREDWQKYVGCRKRGGTKVMPGRYLTGLK